MNERNISNAKTEHRVQAKRIERIVARLLNPEPHRITFVYSEEGISFMIDGANGRILAESYRETSVSEIENMDDDKIANRLKELFASTRRLLHYPS